ncbi:MAG: hypothetical protein JXX29_15085 [Deltaproteobacteria bacterium]|nr:hypothetical protein [Deltaproteobacteria bacterium]MBN2673005.1 hypothetical protein [Deltaproteobacteria bacterium]
MNSRFSVGRNVWIAGCLVSVLVSMGLISCSDKTNDDNAEPGDSDSSTAPQTGTDDSESNLGDDSDTATSSQGNPDLLRLENMPSFRMPLPSSLTKKAPQSKAITPDELNEVQSEGFYQLQEDRVFTSDIYLIRGLLTYLEQYTQANDVPEDTVVELGVQTDVTYEGGPDDGQVMNPHLYDLNSPHEGVDLGRLRWWSGGDGITVLWHLSDEFFADFPYWHVEITPSETDSTRNRYQVAAFRTQWDGIQENQSVRYVTFDEATNETTMFFKTVDYNMSSGANISFVTVAMKQPMAQSNIDTETETETEIDTATETDSETDTSSEPDVDTATEGNVDTASALDELIEETVVYKATGTIDPATGEPALTSQIAAVGNSNGGGVVASTIPFDMWDDGGNFVNYQYYFRELYNGEGNLISRAYSKKFDDVTELSKFSWFQPDTEAINYVSMSPDSPPEAIYYRYEYDFLSSVSTHAYSLLPPDQEAWTSMTQEESVLRVIWKQQSDAGAPWRPGDVVYEYSMSDAVDCSIEGETSCNIHVYRPHSVWPVATTVFGQTFYAEQQWPLRYLSPLDTTQQMKVALLDTWPYTSAWLEQDDNDVYDDAESALDCAVFDVYYYTPGGEEVAESMPMLYSTVGELPNELMYDTDAEIAAQSALIKLGEVLEEFVPSQPVIPTSLILPTEEEFLAQFEVEHLDTETAQPDTDTSVDTDSSSTDTETTTNP